MGIEDDEHSTVFELGIDMERPVEVSAVGPSAVDNIAFEDVAILFVPIDLAADHVADTGSIVESQASITGLYAKSKVALDDQSIMVNMFVERFNRCCIAAAVVFGQGSKHPARAWRLVPGAVMDVLSRMDDLLGAR